MGSVPKRLPVQTLPQFPDNCTSVLKKVLTEEIWKDLRVLKTKYGGRLANCIIAGVENPSLPVGVYACDPDAYKEYKDLFGPVIKEIYDYDIKSEAIVKHNYDLSGLDWERMSKTKYCVKYIQVKGSRNLEGYPFVPLLDTTTKNEIENKLRKVITDDIDVRLEMNNIPEGHLKQLSEDGLMFEKHPGVEKAIPNSKFNEGCYVYCKNDLSQVVWINADDHLQYSITEKFEPDLRTVCEKLFDKLKSIEANLSISHSDNLGYITCNPCNLGTAIKIKVIIQLEKTTGQDINIETLDLHCKQYGVEVKNSMEGVYELTLFRTLQVEKTESDLIGGLLVCMEEILKYEEHAIQGEEEVIRNKLLEASGNPLKNMPQFDEINTSLVRPFINKETWLKYGNKTTNHKNTLKDCLKPGIANHKVGLIAFDADCYNKFEEIFMNVAQICHEDYRLIDLHVISAESLRFSDSLRRYDSWKYVIDGYLMWQGNLKDIPFPPGLNRKSREECNSRLLAILDSYWKENNLTLFGIDEDVKLHELLFFKDIISEKTKIPELSIEWPDQRRILRDTSGKVNIFVNVINHLALEVSIQSKTFPEDVLKFLELFNRIVIKQSDIWGFSEKFGFLETLPIDVGSGFGIKVALRLPSVLSAETYKPLVEQKKVLITVSDNIMYLTHKHKFKNIYQCIIDVMDVTSSISRLADQKEIFTTELLKTYEDIKTSKGTTVNKLLEVAKANSYSSNALFIESVESFNTFHDLYTHALKYLSDNTFNLNSFNCKLTEALMEPLKLPSIPEGVIGKVIEVSRNIAQIPFPAFMNDKDRADVATLVSEVLKSLEVSFGSNGRKRIREWCMI